MPPELSPAFKPVGAFYMEHEPLAVSIKQACCLLSVGKTSIYKLLKRRSLERCTAGCRRTLITMASIHRLIDSTSASAAEDRR